MALIAHPDEKRIFHQIAEGDAHAFRILFDHYRAGIYRLVLRTTQSETIAEEISQEVFLQIWKGREQLADIQNPSGWLFTLARNRTINQLKKIANDEELRRNLWRQLSETHNTTEEQIQLNDSRRLIETALQELSPQKQRIFNMSRHEGLSHEQIAEALHLSKNTVKNNLVETLKWLRTRLKDHAPLVAILLMLEEVYK